MTTKTVVILALMHYNSAADDVIVTLKVNNVVCQGDSGDTFVVSFNVAEISNVAFGSVTGAMIFLFF